MDEKTTLIGTLLVLTLFIIPTGISISSEVDPVFDNVAPYDQQGYTPESAREAKYEVDVASEKTDLCRTTLQVYNYTEFNKTDVLYQKVFEEPCQSMNDTSSIITIWDSVEKTEGDYLAEFTLERQNSTGTFVEEDFLSHSFRIGTSIDMFAGMVGIPYNVFRILIGTILTLVVGGAAGSYTKSGVIGGIAVVGMIITFTAIDWFPALYMFLTVIISIISTHFIR